MILSPVLGIPENAGVMLQFRPLLGRGEGRGDVATSDFVPFAIAIVAGNRLGGAMPLNKSTTYHAPPPLFQFFCPNIHTSK